MAPDSRLDQPGKLDQHAHLIMPAFDWVMQGPRPLIPDAAVKHVNFVDFPSIHPGYKSKLYR